MLSLPFFVVYFLSKKSWWALIPGGGLTSISIVVALQSFIQDKGNSLVGIYTGSLLLAFAAIFGILWLRRKTQPTSWAIYPAAGLCALAILSFTLGNGWNSLTDRGKAIFFAVLSVISFIGYFIHGLRKWGWLFPALFCAAMAITMWMSINDMQDSPLMMVPLLASIAVPFSVGYALHRKQLGLLIMAFISTSLMLFFVVADSNLGDGTGVFFVFALPFFIIYFLSQKNWWAFVPAGVCTSFGLMGMLETLIPHKEYGSLPGLISWDVFIWVLFLGFAATFGIVWLRRKTQPTDWARYPALGFVALTILSLVLGEHFQEHWLAASILIIGGIFLLASLDKVFPAIMRRTPDLKA